MCMSFQRATSQGHRSFREHYEQAANGTDLTVAESARLMIRLIEQLEVAFGDRDVWGLTRIYSQVARNRRLEDALVCFGPPA